MLARLALPTVMLAQLALVACGGDAPRDEDSAAAPPAASRDTVVTDSTAWVAYPERLGVIRTGMLRPTLIDAVGQPTRFGYDSQERCTYIGGSALPDGVLVMVLDSAVARIDVTKPGVPTAEGIQVGDTEAAVLQRYGARAVVTPHKYTGPAGHYVTVTSPTDTLHRIVFETDGTIVKSYRVGRMPEVTWVEGCS
ncbi:MAG TPA: hypothetical protein VFT96_04430 [Gemmatimonadaceae bacterium]|nr:hypothetical protein [Gemmatimonadaceae bacterium]